MNKTKKELVEEFLDAKLEWEVEDFGKDKLQSYFSINGKKPKEWIEQALDQAHTAGRQERTAEVVEGKIKEYKDRFNVGDTVRWINQGGNLTGEQANSIKYLGHSQALTDIKNHLTE